MVSSHPLVCISIWFLGLAAVAASQAVVSRACQNTVAKTNPASSISERLACVPFPRAWLCANRGKCDKPGRENTNDPCSECRHFAAGDSDCALAKNLTYNDQAWVQMMMRGEHGYNLAPPKDRLAPVRKRKPETSKLPAEYTNPLPDDKVKPGWQGKSKEELLVAADFLPVHVREYPRAYLVPSRVNEEKKRKNETFPQQSRLPVARSIRHTATPESDPAFTNISQPLDLIHTMRPPIPPQVPNRDAVMEFRFNYKEIQASYHYQDGSEFRPPAGPR